MCGEMLCTRTLKYPSLQQQQHSTCATNACVFECVAFRVTDTERTKLRTQQLKHVKKNVKFYMGLKGEASAIRRNHSLQQIIYTLLTAVVIVAAAAASVQLNDADDCFCLLRGLILGESMITAYSCPQRDGVADPIGLSVPHVHFKLWIVELHTANETHGTSCKGNTVVSQWEVCVGNVVRMSRVM